MSLNTPLALIFGGCCSNVFALESIINHEPDSGTDLHRQHGFRTQLTSPGLLITTTQLFFVALFTLPTQFERRSSKSRTSTTTTVPPNATKVHNPDSYTHHDPHPTSSLTNLLLPYRFKHPQVPLRRLLNASVLFCLVNLLNNWAFAFDISVPMHILLRSFGSVLTLIVGWMTGKRYGKIQVLGVMGLTAGVVMAAWADAAEKGADLTLAAPSDSSASSFAAGLVVLFVAQLLAAIMGVYTEDIYATHGRHWKEILFYTHFFGLLLSLALLPSLLTQFDRLFLGPRFTVPTAVLSYLQRANVPSLPTLFRTQINKGLNHILARTTPWSNLLPSQSILLLLLNAITQCACISGVNQLGAQTSAVTVTVVLNIRKLASFILSCVVFGNELTPMMVKGAGVVFASGAVYGFGGARAKSRAAKAKAADKENDEADAQVRDSLAIAKDYATSPAATAKKVWQEVHSSVEGMMEGSEASASQYPPNDEWTSDSEDARVNADGTMSLRGSGLRGLDSNYSETGSGSTASQNQSSEAGESTGRQRAVLHSDGTMSRR